MTINDVCRSIMINAKILTIAKLNFFIITCSDLIARDPASYCYTISGGFKLFRVVVVKF